MAAAFLLLWYRFSLINLCRSETTPQAPTDADGMHSDNVAFPNEYSMTDACLKELRSLSRLRSNITAAELLARLEKAVTKMLV